VILAALAGYSAVASYGTPFGRRVWIVFWFANVVVWVLGWWFVKIVIVFWFAKYGAGAGL
jgi:hypothetical protein